MNKRIQELAEQAGLEYDFNPMLWLKYEKFAELIVEQCAAIIESQDVDPSFKLRMSWAVKQYIGVEE